MADDKVPFFATPEKEEEKEEKEEKEEPTVIAKATSEEAKVEELVQDAIAKEKRAAKMQTKQGVDYAPWMNIDKEEEKKNPPNFKGKGCGAGETKREGVESIRNSVF